MKILYDITVIGYGQKHASGRTGVYRVVENVAQSMIGRKEFPITFTADTNNIPLIDAAEKYINSSNVFNGSDFLVPTFYGVKKKLALYRQQLLELLLDKTVQINFFKKLVLRVQLKIVNQILQIIVKENIPYKQLSSYDIFHSPFYAISKGVQHANVKNIFITVYDLIPVLHPEFFEEGLIDLFNQILDSINTNTWVLCISHSTRNDLLKFMGNKVNPKRVLVTQLAASEMFYKSVDKQYNATIRSKYNIPNTPYVLSLCTLEPRKNIHTAIRAFAQMVQENHIADLNLVLVGTKGWLFDNIFNEIDNLKNIQHRIIVTGFMADEDLAAIYSDALMFVYPSYYEGFGLPPLEAMQCGVPVITSNTSSLPEVVGDAGIMVHPDDMHALGESMLRVYKDEALRNKMSAASLEQAKKFSWERCAQETIAAYQLSLSQS